MVSEYQAPHDASAEAAVIGAILLDGACMPEAQTILQGKDFYVPAHRMVWEAAAYAVDQGQTPDMVVLRSILTQRKQMATVGGVSALQRLMSSVPSSAQMELYAAQVRRHSELRSLYDAGLLLQSKVMAGEDPAEIRERVEIVLRNSCSDTSDWVHIGDVGAAFRRKGVTAQGWDIGLPDLQYATGGLWPGLNMLAGMPGAGKTTLACQFVVRALRGGHKVCVVSMDQPKEALFGIMWQNASGSRDDDLERDGQAEFRKLVDSSVYFYAGRFDLSRIASALRVKASQGYDWALVDYLSLIHVAGARSPHDAAEAAAKGILAVARDCGMTVLLIISYTKRRDGGAPDMQDSRGSLEIAHAGEQMWILTRAPDPNCRSVDVNVVKSRHRPIGRVKLCYRGDIRRFYDEEAGNDADRSSMASRSTGRVCIPWRECDAVDGKQGLPQARPADDSPGAAELARRMAPGGSAGVAKDDEIPF